MYARAGNVKCFRMPSATSPPDLTCETLAFFCTHRILKKKTKAESLTVLGTNISHHKGFDGKLIFPRG